MHPIELTSHLSSAENAQRKGDRGDSGFRIALENHAIDQLQLLLDPNASASLPGAASALTNAELSKADASAQASSALQEQALRQGARDRGLDAASRARESLSSAAGTNAESAEPITKSPAESAVRQDGTKAAPPPRAEHAESENRSDHALRQETREANQLNRSQTLTEPAQKAPETPPAVQRADAAFASISRLTKSNTPAGATQHGAVQSIQPAIAAATAKVSAPVAPGEIADRRSAQTASPKPIYRQETRTFDAQLQRGLAQVLRQKGGTLNLKLTPVELGEVRIALSVSNGRVDGSIEATTQSARSLLEQNLETLKRSLEQRGVMVDRLEVRLAETSSIERTGSHGQEAHADSRHESADAGRDHAKEHAQGEDRPERGSGGTPGSSITTGQRGAGAEHDDRAHGSAHGPMDVRLHLDTLA